MISLNDLSRERSPELLQTVARVAASGWYLNGPETEMFEDAFAAYLGVEYATGVASGTDALTLSLAALEVGRGCRVGTVANAGGYSTVACARLGADAVYIDVDRRTGCISVDALAQAIGDLDVLVVTHLYGQLADMPGIMNIASSAAVPVVEDCAHSPGARIGAHMAGSFGSLAAFSFYPTKNLGALGDAGLVAGRDPVLIQRVRRLASYGWHRRFVVALDAGFNSRMDEIQAAVLSLRLPALDELNGRRRRIARRYALAIPGHDGCRLLFEDTPAHVAHLAVIETEHREQLVAHFATCGVQTGVHYPVPDYRQPAWDIGSAGLEQTDTLTARVLTIPCFPSMTETEIRTVEDALSTIPG